MADISLCTFKNGKNSKLAPTFYLILPNTPPFHRKHPRLNARSQKFTWRVTSCLLGEAFAMESLTNIPQLGKNIGGIGAFTVPNVKQTRSFTTNHPSHKPPSIILTGYDARVRTGAYGHRAEVTVQTVSTALGAITVSFELGGERSPALKSEGHYITLLKHERKGFCREEPTSIPQLAVPDPCVSHSQIPLQPPLLASSTLYSFTSFGPAK